MQKILRAAGAGLNWSQPKASRMEYELRSGDELVGTLKVRSMWGTLATAEAGDGCWTFKRVGFWQNRVTIRVCGADADLAVFTNNTWANGGTLEFPDGRRVRATTNFWRTSLAFQTDADEPLVQFRYGGLFRRHAHVEIAAAATGVSEVPLLVFLGWYLAVMLARDDAAAAAAAAG